MLLEHFTVGPGDMTEDKYFAINSQIHPGLNPPQLLLYWYFSKYRFLALGTITCGKYMNANSQK